MREYTTTDGQRIRSIGREKRIIWTASGEPYFMWSGRREHMSDVIISESAILTEYWWKFSTEARLSNYGRR